MYIGCKNKSNFDPTQRIVFQPNWLGVDHATRRFVNVRMLMAINPQQTENHIEVIRINTATSVAVDNLTSCCDSKNISVDSVEPMPLGNIDAAPTSMARG